MNMAAYDDSVLDEDVHRRLIADIDRITTVANIPKHMVYRTMKDFCTPEEIEWVKHIRNREGDKQSLAYVGVDSKVPVESRMMAMTGALLRNFIDARLMTVQEVLHRMKDDEMPEPTVLMIPNFFISKEQGGHVAAWDISNLLGLLISRMSAGKVTVLYVQDWEALKQQYGKPIHAHVETYFHLIE